VNCLSPTPCGHHAQDGCKYPDKCIHKSDFVAPTPPPVDEAERDAKQQIIRDAAIRYWTDKNIFYADSEELCDDHNVNTVPAGVGLWACPVCMRSNRAGTPIPGKASLPYKDPPEPPELDTNE
jgi:hypothetical protein